MINNTINNQKCTQNKYPQIIFILYIDEMSSLKNMYVRVHQDTLDT